MLVASTSSSKLQRAHDRVLRKLTVGFLISNKRELTMQLSITWVGKEVCREGKCISNSAASIAQCVFFLLPGPLMTRLPWERLMSLQGGLQWVARPRCTLRPSLLGAHRGVEARSSCFCGQMLRSLSTVVVFACLPFAPPPPPCRHSTHRNAVHFCDAAPTPEPGCCRAGLISTDGLWRSTRCPQWVCRLQAAELWAAASAIKIAVNKNERRIWLGLHSEGARWILGRVTSAGHCVARQRTLWRQFWLRG